MIVVRLFIEGLSDHVTFLFYQARAPKSIVIIVGTHLDHIEASQQRQLEQRYHELIHQSFSNHHDLPFCWPQIASVHFVGLVSPETRALFPRDIYVDELRECIYDTALDMKLPMGEFSVDYIIIP